MKNFTAADVNEAMDLAYGMGMKKERTEDDYESAMGFAYSMGLKKTEVTAKAPKKSKLGAKLVFANLF